MIINYKQEIVNKMRQEKQKKIEDYRNNKKIIQDYRILNKPYQLKYKYDSIIPLHFYTCWHTKDLPPLMSDNYKFLQEANPKITFHLYDEEDCRNFIKQHFESPVLRAYNSLIPCSYKSDLWRYCVLYINGGIYMDIKYRCVNGFKFISLTEEEYFVRDCNSENVYTALIVSLPRNEILKNCIYRIVDNVKNRFYGKNSLDPTGPGLLGSYFSQPEKNSLKLYHSISFVEDALNKYYIVKDDRIILSFYDGYRDEQTKMQKNKHYSQLWDEKKIYN
jgi:mannosyltransferase OCH1-like enzyme